MYHRYVTTLGLFFGYQINAFQPNHKANTKDSNPSLLPNNFKSTEPYSNANRQNPFHDRYFSQDHLKNIQCLPRLFSRPQNSKSSEDILDPNEPSLPYENVLKAMLNYDTNSPQIDLKDCTESSEKAPIKEKSPSPIAKTSFPRRISTLNPSIISTDKTDPQDIPKVLQQAIFDYTLNTNSKINKALMSGNKQEISKFKLQIDQIDQCLTMLPSHTGIVYRGLHLSNESRYPLNGMLCEPAFVSTSCLAREAFEGETLFIITLKQKRSRGKLIDKFSNYPHEKEVLFQRNTLFRVTEKEYDLNPFTGMQDRVNIYLEEC